MAVLDPVLVLATAMQASRGAYALLIGSGVSRGAGIPTGWDVTLDLVRRVAERRGVDCSADPFAWFESEYGVQPSYSKLLGELARTATERRQLLREYFEPSEEETRDGLKAPGPAHKAVARLVKRSHIRVILTTNFDRLLERALDEEGIAPQVVAAADAVKGMLPLAHSGCTVVKLHGDYLDARLRNTEDELASYPRPLQRLLDQVLEEYGLVICGWSGEWDSALCRSLQRRANRRFSTFWAIRGEPREATRQVLSQLGAQTIAISDADSFFTRLEETVAAIDDLLQAPPLSIQAAVASLKRYVADPRYVIRASDLLAAESEALVENLGEDAFPRQGGDTTPAGIQGRLEKYENLTERLGGLMAVGCHWGEEPFQELWGRCLRRVVNAHERHQGLILWLNMRLYPSLLLMYAGGIAAIDRRMYTNLASLLLRAVLRDERRETACGLALHTQSVMVMDAQKAIPGLDRRYTPLSDRLADLLPSWLRGLLPDPAEFIEAFDLFEYFLGLVHFDLERERSSHAWGPPGCFVWRGSWSFDSQLSRPALLLDQEQQAEGSHWGALEAGFFGASEERFRESKDGFDAFVRQLAARWF